MPAHSISPLDYAIQAARRSLDLAHRLLVGIKADQFARLPAVGGADGDGSVGVVGVGGSGGAGGVGGATTPRRHVIRTNHPAFIYGHLSLYPAKIITICGLDPAAALPPEGFDERFRRELPCHDDPSATIYPPLSQITAAFFANYEALFAALPAVTAETLARPNPDARLAATFPTVGFATHFLMCSHLATHLGQVSAWRRCIGLPPV